MWQIQTLDSLTQEQVNLELSGNSGTRGHSNIKDGLTATDVESFALEEYCAARFRLYSPQSCHLF